MGFKRPSFVSNSADELATVIDGTYFADRKPDVNLAYGQAKLIGILWMAYLARQYPDRRFICVSPGNTTGTQAPNDLALPFRMAAKYVMPAPGYRPQTRRGREATGRRCHRPDPVQRRVLRQRGRQDEGSHGRPNRHLPRPGQPVIPGPRQRGHPPLYQIKTFAQTLQRSRRSRAKPVRSAVRVLLVPGEMTARGRS